MKKVLANMQAEMVRRMEMFMLTQRKNGLGPDLSLGAKWTLMANSWLGVSERYSIRALHQVISEFPLLRSYFVSENGLLYIKALPAEEVDTATIFSRTSNLDHFNTTDPKPMIRVNSYLDSGGNRVFGFYVSHAVVDGKSASQVLARAAELRIKYAAEETMAMTTLALAIGTVLDFVPNWAPFIPAIGVLGLNLATHREPANLQDIGRYAEAQRAILDHRDFDTNLGKYCELSPPVSFPTDAKGFKASPTQEAAHLDYKQEVWIPNLEQVRTLLASRDPVFSKLDVAGHSKSTLSLAILAKYAFMGAIRAVTETSVTIREQRRLDPAYETQPQYGSCSWHSNVSKEGSDFSLRTIHIHMAALRKQLDADKKTKSGPFEMVPLEGYLDQLKAINPTFDPLRIAEFNPVGRAGEPPSPIFEHHLATLFAKASSALGFHSEDPVHGEIDFGRWVSEDYGPAVSAAAVVNEAGQFHVKVTSRQYLTEPGLPKAISTAMATILAKWADNPDLKISEMGIQPFGVAT